jgi:prepilin-type processing-associated H-X9-DG protein/prepilin-type N-terminal cleavage/methylation domain-containing protein
MNTPTCGQALRTRAVTLVELIVVIAIVALLAALLLPALSRARAKGQSAACKNNQRQIGLSLAMYLADHHRYPPMWGEDMGDFQTWSDRLSPYTSISWTNSSWHCPAYIANKGVIKLVKPPQEVLVFTSYSYNAYGIADQSDSLNLGLGIRRSPSLASEPEVLAPSEMYTVADSRTFRDMLFPGQGMVKGPIGTIEMRAYDDPPEEMAPFHGKGYNILFADGHVVFVNRGDYLFPPRSAQHWNRDNRPHTEAWAPRKLWAVQQ